MIDGGVEILNLPTISGFLERLAVHAKGERGEDKWGFYPGAKGEVLTAEMAAKVPETERWIGHRVFDGNGLVEEYVNLSLKGDAAERMKIQYDEWCYGHIGENMDEMVELPGGAVFKKDENGVFTDVGYLYRKVGSGKKEWEIFVCSNAEKGLCVEQLDDSWNCWGLISMILRYNIDGPVTEGLEQLPKGTPYAVVGSSVLNFRQRPGERLITSLPNSTVVQLTGKTEGDWTEVIVGDTKGFVFSKFLEKHPEG